MQKNLSEGLKDSDTFVAGLVAMCPNFINHK
jgi:hypothetical protein